MNQESSAIVRKLENYFEEPQAQQKKKRRPIREPKSPGVFTNALLVVLMSVALTATKLALWATRKVNRIESQYDA
jgi:hypothetical protein